MTLPPITSHRLGQPPAAELFTPSPPPDQPASRQRGYLHALPPEPLNADGLTEGEQALVTLLLDLAFTAAEIRHRQPAAAGR